jgi:hypothetical protein
MKPELTELEFVKLNAPNVWEEYVKLKEFYKIVAKLTLNHDELNDSAVVYPSKLGPELEKIDKEWWKFKK